MDIGKSFTYMFEDKKWVEKLLIGGLVTLIPIVNFIAFGYALRALKNVAEGKEPVLPEWDDWGGDWVRGLLASLVAPLVYSLPIAVAAIPYGIAQVALGYSAADVCSVAFSCLSSLWGIAVAVVLPAGVIKYAMEGEFVSLFRFSEIFALIGDNLSNYIVALLLIIAASLVAGLVGFIACGVGLIFTSFWATLVSAHLLGQVQAEAVPASASASLDDPSYGELGPDDLSSDVEDAAG